jgi:UDP-N-acetylmuramyl pentapeptide phosphotransferase/UDP-N-acetylglucosamine-1-phosphate transferase
MVFLVIIFLASMALCYMETGALLKILRKRNMVDIPNERSNHKAPTPRGGGISVVDTMLFGGILMLVLFGSGPSSLAEFWPFFLALVAIAAVSFWDDLKGAPITARLGAQVFAAILSVPIVQNFGLVFQGLLPPTLDGLLVAILWVWGMNLYNFMDGIDGITGSETASIAFGLAGIFLFAPNLPEAFGTWCVVILGAIIGFLKWNWHPAKLFLGDVGSVSLGFVLFGMLFILAAHGLWEAALLLPGYYLADSGITLIRRAKRGEKIWQAHSQHFYQQAVRRGATPPQVVFSILLSNAVLILLAWRTAAVDSSATKLFLLMLGVIETLVLLWYLARRFPENKSE